MRSRNFQYLTIPFPDCIVVAMPNQTRDIRSATYRYTLSSVSIPLKSTPGMVTRKNLSRTLSANIVPESMWLSLAKIVLAAAMIYGKSDTSRKSSALFILSEGSNGTPVLLIRSFK